MIFGFETTFTLGIIMEVKQLFEQFFTVNSARSEQSTGLALTKELVEQMEHIICAEGLDRKLNIIIKWRY